MSLPEFIRRARRTRAVAWAREHNALVAVPASVVAMALVLVGLFGNRGLLISAGLLIFATLGVFGSLFDC